MKHTKNKGMLSKPSTTKSLDAELSFIFEPLESIVGPTLVAEEFNLLINKILALVSCAHMEHVNARNYARHMALGELYGCLPAAADPLMELCVLEYGDVKYVDCCKEGTTCDELLEDVCMSIYRMEELTDCLAKETTLGDLSLFLKGIKYKLERLS
jgi:hypothetical protein